MDSQMETKKPSEVMEAVSGLGRGLEKMISGMEALVVRLEPIMRPAVPTPMNKDVSEKIERMPSGLRMSLIQATEEVEKAWNILQDIKARLEI